MAHQHHCEAVGAAEIAERLGMARSTINVWRHRGLLPEPCWTVHQDPAWCWHDIERWARETGRLKDGKAS